MKAKREPYWCSTKRCDMVSHAVAPYLPEVLKAFRVRRLVYREKDGSKCLEGRRMQLCNQNIETPRVSAACATTVFGFYCVQAAAMPHPILSGNPKASIFKPLVEASTANALLRITSARA